MAAPTFVSLTNSGFTSMATQTITSASIAVQNGDVIVSALLVENASGIYYTGTTVATASGSTSAWTQAVKQPTSFDANRAFVFINTATATATGNITVRYTMTSSGAHVLLLHKVWRNATVGTSVGNDNGTSSGAPTVSITTTAANSAIDYYSDDWNAVAGTATFTSSAGTPISDVVEQSTAGTTLCEYSSRIADAGAAGAKTMGMSSPSTQRYVVGVVEIKGTGAAPPPATGGTLAMMGVG